MPRQRKQRLFPISLSPAAAAEAMKLPLRVIREGVYRTGEIPAYIVAGRVRIPVPSLLDWLKSKPRATLSRTRRKHHD